MSDPDNDSRFVYWRISKLLSHRWFKEAILRKSAQSKERIQPSGPFNHAKVAPRAQLFAERIELSAANGIELFINGMGIGVLSISVTLASDAITDELATEFNYLASRVHARRPAGLVHRMHPSEDRDRWARISEEARQQIGAPPADDVALFERISSAGGSYTLGELTQMLLEPLRTVGYRPLRDSFLVFTVVHGSASIDLQDSATIRRLGPFLAGLTQVEEAIHAGAPAGPPNMAQDLLNRCHWAAVGMLGAAHLIIDQAPPPGHDDHPFNAQRVGRVRDKYFIPYLVALMQRLQLQTLAEEAVPLAGLDGHPLRTALSQVRTSLLKFGVRGNPTQTSSREVLHRYYRLSQAGLDIEPAWTELRATLADFDSKVRAEQQIASIDATNLALAGMTEIQSDAEQIGRRIDKTLNKIEGLHHVAHRLEIFLVAVYAAHLWHMVAHENHQWLGEYAEIATPVGVLACAIVGGIGTYGFQLWAHRRHEARNRKSNP